jgi:YebC/PmpR family DNA-binding regulatory protein
MAGHSKWANIKHKKERADAKKGKVFSRIAKEIISAVKLGGEDAKNNPRLRLALQKAKAVNMPNDNIERNIKKASSTDQSAFEEMTYELYGHGGVGLIIEAMTDNKNRTASDMCIATNKCGGNIANPGAVAYNFERKGVIRISKEQGSEEDLFMLATECGADDFEVGEEGYLVLTDPSELFNVKEKIDAEGIQTEDANLEMFPKLTVDCDETAFESNMKLIEWLEELDDVDAVYHQLVMPPPLEEGE